MHQHMLCLNFTCKKLHKSNNFICTNPNQHDWSNVEVSDDHHALPKGRHANTLPKIIMKYHCQGSRTIQLHECGMYFVAFEPYVCLVCASPTSQTDVAIGFMAQTTYLFALLNKSTNSKNLHFDFVCL